MKEYGVSYTAISKWIKQYSEVTLEDDTIMTAKQIKDLQRRNALLEEENLILNKAIAIFTPTQTKIRCYSCIEKPAFNQTSLQSN